MRKKWLIWLGASVLVLIGAMSMEHWACSENNTLPIEQIEQTLSQKESLADSTLNWLAQNCDSTSPADWLQHCGNADIVYFVTKQDALVFWSSSLLDVSNEQFDKLAGVDEQYIHTDNAHCVVKTRIVGDYVCYAFIVVKSDYKLPQSSVVTRALGADFGIDENVEFSNEQNGENQSVFGRSGYLFSLKSGENCSTDSRWLWFVISLYVLLFVLAIFLVYHLDWLLGSNFWSLQHYLSFVIGALLIVLSLLHLNWPNILFAQELFSPLHYAANSVFASLGHLLIIAISALVCVVIFYFKVRLKVPRKISCKTIVAFCVCQLISFAFFASIYFIVVSVVRNSSFDVTLTRVENLSIYSVTALIVLFVSCLSSILICDKLVILFKYCLRKYVFYVCDVILLVASCCVSLIYGNCDIHWIFAGCFVVLVLATTIRLYTPHHWRYWQIACTAFVVCLLLVLNLMSVDDSLKREKYAVLAENLANDVDNNVDVYILRMLENVDCDIQVDNNLRTLLMDRNVTPDDLTRYIDENYFRNYWHDEYNYSLKALAVGAYLPVAHRYDKQIADGSLCLCTEHFYANDMKNDSYRYLGVFDFRFWNGTKRLFVLLNKNDDSEQNALLLPSNGQVNMSLSMAKYVGGEKVYNSGRYVYPVLLSDLVDTNSEKVYSNDFLHRIYCFDNDVCVVVGERQPIRKRAVCLFLIYFFVASLLLLSLLHFGSLLVRKSFSRRSLLALIQHVYTSSSIIILTITLFISIIFIYQQHRENLLQRQTDHVRQAQKQLEKYVERQSLDNVVELAFVLQDMSKLYRSDVNLYDASGTLIATSRPYLFSAGLYGKQMNPQVYFAKISKAVSMDERIGKLSYLASYAPITNEVGDVVAYVGLPQLFSSHQLSRRLFNYLALFLFVYLLFLILTAFFGHYVGGRILKPLRIVGQKMRSTQLGATNEKIVYSGDPSDEIGLLVGEYNAMVEKLDESARLLARSERESAWRDMARQISHEIRNPLTPMKLTIQQLQRLKYTNGEEFDERFKKYSQMFVEQIDSMAQMATDFSKFAQVPTANPVDVELTEKVQQVVDLFSHNSENTEVVYEQSAESVLAYVDAEHITLLLNNLIKNAIQAIPSNRMGRVEVSLTRDEQHAIIVIKDNGCGISEEAREKLFMPNFTTKSSGMGLGLYLVQNIVKLANGDISFESKIDVGTTFRVVLPLAKR